MAEAFKCDRCGDYFDMDPNGNTEMTICVKVNGRPISGHTNKRYNLCPHCAETLGKWVSEKILVNKEDKK